MKNFNELTNEQIFEIAQLALSSILDWDAITEFINTKGKAPEQRLRIEKDLWDKKENLEVIRVYIDGMPDTWCAIWELEEGNENKIDVTVVEDKNPTDVSNYTIIVKKLMEWGFIEKVEPQFKIEQVSPVNNLIEALKGDPDYFRSWKDNIAMSFKDEYWRSYEKYMTIDKHETIHEISNNAAENFLNLLCKDNE